MARTGIAIQVTNTTLGSPPQVNANSFLVVVGATAVTGGDLAFSLDVPYMIQSVDDLDLLGITAVNNPDIVKQVSDFYAPKSGVNTTGTVLWLVGAALSADVKTGLADWVRATVVSGFQYRPRNLAISEPLTNETPLVQKDVQAIIDELYVDGFSTVALIGSPTIAGTDPAVWSGTIEDLSPLDAHFVGTVIVTDVQGGRPCVGKLLGYVSTLAVGTSIGDGTDSAFSDSMFFVDTNNTPCAKISLNTANMLGDKQYMFTRTRPPKNGLWWNDGATAADATTALSTLENGRTIASIVDDLRSFFVPYINSKVPVSSNGDIQPTYKQVVLDSARSKVVIPYIENGDISDARITLIAKNNDMVGTRTWECTLEILDAPTLRWVDGYVFYVKSL